jgi:hypothetical protein
VATSRSKRPRPRCATTSSSLSGSSSRPSEAKEPAHAAATRDAGRRGPRPGEADSAGARRRRRTARRLPHRRSPRRCSTPARRLGPPEGFTVHPKLKPCSSARRDGPRGRDRLGHRASLLALRSLLMEGTPVRLAGQDSRRGTFVQRTRCSSTSTTPRSGLRCSTSPDQAQVLGLRLAAVGVRRDGLRVRLLGRAARRPRAVGGAVRRLRQRRPDDRRRVHLLLRAEVGPALSVCPAAPPRLRGTRTRPLLGPHRALPHDVCRWSICCAATRWARSTSP